MWGFVAAILLATGAYACVQGVKSRVTPTRASQVSQEAVARIDKTSLFHRLGGIFAIAMVVNHFSDSLEDDPRVGRNGTNVFMRQWWAEKSAERHPGLKYERTSWLIKVAGGPGSYVPTRIGFNGDIFNLDRTHCPLQLTSEDFDSVAGRLKASLEHYHVPQRETTETLTAFAAHKHEVILGSKVNGHCSL